MSAPHKPFLNLRALAAARDCMRARTRARTVHVRVHTIIIQPLVPKWEDL